MAEVESTVRSDSIEVFRHAIEGIVEEAGISLQRSAYSTNIKIRRDFTCALFDSDLRHIAMHDIAPHHIGSVALAVPKVLKEWDGDLAPGEGIIFNDPALGTIHLPDVFIVSPLYHDNELLGYSANIAHHVDTGASTPGGMPTDSTSIYEEGLIIPAVKGIKDWQYDPDIFVIITRNVRVPKIRKGDARAQLAANQVAQQRYSELIQEYDIETITEYLDRLLDYTEERVRSEFRKFPDGVYEAEDYLDGDGVNNEPVLLKLSITIDGDEMVVDFTGSASQNEGPLNSPTSFLYGAILSVVMSVIEGSDIPKNAGMYRPIEFIAPEGSMVNPEADRPVAGVGVVSMRAADLAMKALSEAAPENTIAGTKGCVVNVAFGGTDSRTDDEYVYYEALAGGYGARPTKDGMDAVQPHFQNTANGPIEEVERDIPVRITNYSLIDGSEGAGEFRGGLGLRRDYEFYDNRASFSILSDRTKTSPWGLFGGEEASPANFEIYREDGSTEPVDSKSTVELRTNDTMSVQTAGGGGYGDPFDRDPDRVLMDVINDKISRESARKDYGVVIDQDVEEVDVDATERLRSNGQSNGGSQE